MHALLGFHSEKNPCFHLYPTLYPLKEQKSNTETGALLSRFGLHVFCTFTTSIYLLLLSQLHFEILSKVSVMQINKAIIPRYPTYNLGESSLISCLSQRLSGAFSSRCAAGARQTSSKARRSHCHTLHCCSRGGWRSRGSRPRLAVQHRRDHQPHISTFQQFAYGRRSRLILQLRFGTLTAPKPRAVQNR